ncbi:hypothetical protein ACVWY1_005103 [Pseudomonas sp. TE6288]
MAKFSESDNGHSHFVFFSEYEEEDFDAFVEHVLTALNVREMGREEGPYSTLVMTEYQGHKLVLTSGSFEGCFISMDQGVAWLAKEIIGRV